MNDLYIITGNAGKLREAQTFFPMLRSINLDLVEIQSMDPHEIIKHKLDEARKHHPGPLIVDDISFDMAALNGLPGPLIKWFLQTIGIDGLVTLAQHYNNPNVRTRCIIGYANGTETSFFEGSLDGTIVPPRGTNGFGWDKIFMPEGHTKTFAEMTAEEKNKISHRKLAFEKLADYLKQ